MNTGKHTQQNKSNKFARTIFLILSGTLAFFIIFYCIVMSTSTFPKGSSINGVYVSEMTEEEAAKAIKKEWQKKELIVYNQAIPEGIFGYGSVIFDFKGAANKALYPGIRMTIKRFFNKNHRIIRCPVTAKKYNREFIGIFNNLPLVKNGKGTVKTRNAYVDLSSHDFNVVREVYGNNLDKDKLLDSIISHMESGQEQFVYKPSDFYERPSVISRSKEIKEQLKYCKKHLSQRIVLTGPIKDFSITPLELDKIKKVKKDGTISISEKAISDLVENQIAPEMTTCGTKRHLTSEDGKAYTVTGGNYGYIVDAKKEKTKLLKDIKSEKDVTRKPIYLQKGSESVKGNDIGNDYIEIDLTKQKIRCITNGKHRISTNIVSGDVQTGYQTPQGVYILRWKERNKTLRGFNQDKTPYASDVSYWMPFNGNIGMHDSPWRSKYGGTIYRYNGSHGCINIPPAKAGIIYENASPGMPVIVHF